MIIVQYGHCSPPEKLRHVEEKSPYAELSKWAQRQRASKLTEERKHLLDELGFLWKPRESRWDSMYQELLKYRKEVSAYQIRSILSFVPPHLP